jgi:heme oxygenase
MDRHSEKPGDVLTALRAATESRHSILDREMPLSRDAPTLSDYRDHLLILRAWLYPLETWMMQFNDGPQGEDYLLKSDKIALIDADLAHPSMPPTPESAPPSFSPLQSAIAPASDDCFYRWGISYVIEGSQLGGVVLQRRLATRLAPHPLRYLNGGGDASGSDSGSSSPGQRWTRFLSNLRAGVVGDQAISQACDGACHAFDRILALHRQNKPLYR